jgi:hypothetical protein
MATELHLGSRFDLSGARHYVGHIAGVKVSTDTLCPSGALSWFAEGLCTLATTECFSVDTGSECASCPAGRVGSGTGQSDISTACADTCPTGKYSAPGSTACEDCGPGRYDHDSSASTPCAECPGGRYGSIVGATDIDVACDGVCPAGSFAPQGSGAAEDCEACAPGKYDDDSDPSTACLYCSSGRYASEAGSFDCPGECAVNTYSAPGSVNALHCEPCGNGQFDNDQDSSTMCTSCPQDSSPHYLEMTDSWGDGWQGNEATITSCDGSIVAQGLTLEGGLIARVDVCLPQDQVGFRVTVNGGSCKREVGWTMYTEDDTEMASGSSPYDGWTGSCPSTDCSGEWSSCDALCTRTYSVFSPATGPSGLDCPFLNGAVEGCPAGQDQCSTPCSSNTSCLANQFCKSGAGAFGSCEACGNSTGCGCTDVNAHNWSPTASQDDGSCDYGIERCDVGTGWSCYTSASCALAGACGEYEQPAGSFADLAETVGLGGTTLSGGKYIWRYVNIASETLTTTNRFAFKFMQDELGVKPRLSITRTFIDDVEVNGRLIAVYSGKTHISYSSFNNVRGGTGAVLYVFGDETTMQYTSITGCSASADDFGTGGGAVGFEGGTMKIKAVTFRDNAVDNAGGAFKVNRAIRASVDIESCLFEQNFAALTGGAVDVRNDVSISISTTKFVNNKAGAETDEANSCWRSSNGDCGYLTGICEIGTDTDDCSSGDHLFTFDPGYQRIYDTSFFPFVQGSAESVAISATAGCDQHPCSAGTGCTYEQYSLSCFPCPDGTAGLDGISCTVCPAGSGPSTDKQSCEPCSPGYYSSFGICQKCEVGAVEDVDGVARAACTECPKFMSSSDGETCGCMPGYYNSSIIRPTCFRGEFEVSNVVDFAVLRECEPCEDLSCVSECYGGNVTVAAKWASVVQPDDGPDVSILLCRVGEACPGGVVQADTTTSCAAGYAPPACGLCVPEYTLAQDGTCQSCTEGNIYGGVIVGTIALLVLALLVKTSKLWFNYFTTLQDIVGLVQELELKVIAKILVATMQILGNLSVVLAITMPEIFGDFLMSFVNFFKFDLVAVFGLGCLSDGGYIHSLVFNLVIVLCILAVVGLDYLYETHSAHMHTFDGSQHNENAEKILKQIFDDFDREGVSIPSRRMCCCPVCFFSAELLHPRVMFAVLVLLVLLVLATTRTASMKMT